MRLNLFCFLLVVVCSLLVSKVSAQLTFISNEGQWEEDFVAQAPITGGALFLSEDAIHFSLKEATYYEKLHGKEVSPEDSYSGHNYKISFGGAKAELFGEDTCSQYHNYFLGSDNSKWRSKVPLFGKMRWENLWEGIDLKFYEAKGSLKYDFKVAAGAQPEQIVLNYEGVEQMHIQNGDLVLELSIGDVIERAPLAYQLIEGKFIEVPCAFQLADRQIRFALGDYDTDHPLVIDPEMVFGSFIGASSDNFGFTATHDPDGNLIGGATVFGASFPTTTGAYDDVYGGSGSDAVISKFSEDGTQLLYSTFLGGSLADMPHSVTTNDNGDIIVMGNTASSNFPTTAGAIQSVHAGGPAYTYPFYGINANNGVDIYVVHFSADGSQLIGSTYMGGSGIDGLNLSDALKKNYGDDFRGEVIADADGNILVASVSGSNDFPTTTGAAQGNYGGGISDGVIFKLSADCSNLDFATYYGGSGGDAAYSVQIDEFSKLYVAGGTFSNDLEMPGGAFQPANAGGADGFIAKYNIGGTNLEFATYVGTPDYDQCFFVQLDTESSIFVLGQTDGTMPLSDGVYGNANSGQFIRKYNASLNNLEWSTTVGTGSGQADISPTAFLVSDCDQIYFSGWGGASNGFWSTTSGLPITADAFQSSTDGNDFYLCVLEEEAAGLNYATFFGGNVSNEHVDGGTSSFDKGGAVYQAVCAGCGGNSDFPTTPDAWSTNNTSTNCNLGVFKFDLGLVNAEIGLDGPGLICEDEPVQFFNESNGGNSFEWTFSNDGSTSAIENPTQIFDEPGTYTINLAIFEDTGCLTPDETSIEITVEEGVNPTADTVDPICPGDGAQLQGYGSENLYWLDDPTLSATNIADPVAFPFSNQNYFLIDFNDCDIDTIPVFVELVEVVFDVGEGNTICVGESTQLEATGGVSYSWTPTESLDNALIATPMASPDTTTVYTVELVTPEGCEISGDITVDVINDFPGGNIYDDYNICIGSSVVIGAIDGTSHSWSPSETLSNPNVQNPSASPTSTTIYFVDITNACGTGTDQVTVNVIEPDAWAGFDGTVCKGVPYPVSATGGVEYQWSPPSQVLFNDQANAQAVLFESGEVSVLVTDEFGCSSTASVFINILPLPYVDAGPDAQIYWSEEATLYGEADGDWEWLIDETFTNTEGINPSVSPEENTWYTLSTIDENGCINHDSVLVSVFGPVYVPNAFTPGTDGINDLFKAEGLNVQDFHIQIFDRWGEMIFESFDIEEGWDGSVRGGEYYAPVAVYSWQVTYRDKFEKKLLKGSVSLVR